MKIVSFLLPLLFCISTAAAQNDAASPPTATFLNVAKGLGEVVAITSTPSLPHKLFVAERTGMIRVLEGEKFSKRDLIDIEEILSPEENPGLSCIALAPDFSESRRIFVSYTDKQGDTIIGMFKTESSSTVDEEGLNVVLKVVQPTPHAHSSCIAFGPDGYLYITLGDSPKKKGSSPLAQNLHSLFGKVLRLDLSNPTNYKVPSDNPYTSRKGAAPEVWALGFQQPLHLSFDPSTKKLLLIDSGREVQEINSIGRGGNYGWSLMQGDVCLVTSCDKANLMQPIFHYKSLATSHAVGGAFYLGKLFPSLQGAYVFGDRSSSELQTLAPKSPAWAHGTLSASASSPITAIGTGSDGEIFVATQDGSLAALRPN